MNVGQAMQSAAERSLRDSKTLYVLGDTLPRSQQPFLVSDQEPLRGGRYNVLAMYQSGQREDWRDGVRAQASVDLVRVAKLVDAPPTVVDYSNELELARQVRPVIVPPVSEDHAAAIAALTSIRNDVEALADLVREVQGFDCSDLLSFLGAAQDDITDLLDSDE